MAVKRAVGLALLFIVTAAVLGATTARGADDTYQRTLVSYTVPDVVLVNQDGAKVRLGEIMNSGKPVIVDFIYGTCTTICPILSASFSNLQRKLGPDTRKIHLVSISIDPEHDTPKVMKEYLKRYGSKPGWDFFTGNRADINKVMFALNAYVLDKMSHPPLMLIKPPGNSKWIRIYGLMGSAEFVAECQKAGIM